MDDNMKIGKSFEDSALLINGVTKTTENKIKVQSGGFRGLLLSRLVENLLGINVRRQRLRWRRNNVLKRAKNNKYKKERRN